MNKYLDAINEINEYISDFNILLSDSYKVPILDINELYNDEYFLNLNGRVWDEFSFPRNFTVGGVYFYFGYTQDSSEKVGIYIGKASLSSTTGKRLWNHFRHAFNDEGKVFKKSYNGDNYHVELITLIPIENEIALCLAPALEEHLIRKIDNNSKTKLINVQGIK